MSNANTNHTSSQTQASTTPSININSGMSRLTSTSGSSEPGGCYTTTEIDGMFSSLVDALDSLAENIDELRAQQTPRQWQAPAVDYDAPIQTQCRYTTAQINDTIRHMCARIDILDRDVQDLRGRIDALEADSDDETVRGGGGSVRRGDCS
ncbi:hypothetical protein AC579_8166 [Pseudocercospora musae]|uniref:Uncharacterized protein n=1 Tax=Pseudocercospora musae TaxID=113226 RepID=A0A139IUY3_9PEZI|nr:hypothetical protein AC579_8166 [Pseudocercospora musae]